MTRCSIRHLTAALTVVEALFGFVTSAAAQPAKVGLYAMTGDRLRAVVAMLVALLGVLSGGFALRSAPDSGGARSAPHAPAIALLAGRGGASLGGVVLANANGGLGTGHGFGGGIVALALGILAVALGAWARIQSRARSSK